MLGLKRACLYCSGDRGDRGVAGGFYKGAPSFGGPGGKYTGDADKYNQDNSGAFK